MPRKYTKHTIEFKETVINDYLENEKHTSYCIIGEKYGISPATVSNWLYQRRNGRGEKNKVILKKSILIIRNDMKS